MYLGKFKWVFMQIEFMHLV
jgi:hypothetical protein